MQREALLPVFSAIASRRDLIDKNQKEEDRHTTYTTDQDQVEENRRENHRNLKNMEMVIAKLQKIVAYYEEALLKKEQEISEDRRASLIKERLRVEEENVRLLVSRALLLTYTPILTTNSVA